MIVAPASSSSPSPSTAAPSTWSQVGTVRRTMRWLLVISGALILALVVTMMPDEPSRSSSDQTVDQRLVSRGELPKPADFDGYFGTPLRDPFMYRPSLALPLPPPSAPAVPVAVAPPPREVPIDGSGLEVLALVGGQTPVACLRDGKGLNSVGIGDEVRGCQVTEITAVHLVLTRGRQTLELTPVLQGRPLVQLPFGSSSPSAPGLRVMVTNDNQRALIRTSSTNPAPRRQLGISVRDAVLGGQGVEISSSIRSDLNVRPGDRLLAIDGQPVTSSADALRLLSERHDAPTITLKLHRAGAELLVSASWKDI